MIKRRLWAKQRVGLLLPSLIVLVLVVIVPLFMALYQSLHLMNYSIASRLNDWVGNLHFHELLHDLTFMRSFVRTLSFAGWTTIIEIILGMLLALWIYALPVKFRAILERLLLIPLFMAPVIVGLAWLFLLHPEHGLITWLFGIKTPLLSMVNITPWTIRLIDVWQWTPFVTLLLIAALDGIPQTLLEAVRLDVLGGWNRFKAIQWPYLKSVIGVVFLLRFLEAFKVFDTVYILTGGGPGDSTDMISIFINRITFTQTRFGYGAAATLILDYLVILVANLLMFLIIKKKSRSQGAIV